MRETDQGGSFVCCLSRLKYLFAGAAGSCHRGMRWTLGPPFQHSTEPLRFEFRVDQCSSVSAIVFGIAYAPLAMAIPGYTVPPDAVEFTWRNGDCQPIASLRVGNRKGIYYENDSMKQALWRGTPPDILIRSQTEPESNRIPRPDVHPNPPPNPNFKKQSVVTACPRPNTDPNPTRARVALSRCCCGVDTLRSPNLSKASAPVKLSEWWSSRDAWSGLSMDTLLDHTTKNLQTRVK